MFIKSERKNWGNGIPTYNEDDLMTNEELYDFALDIMADYLTKNKFEIIFISNDMNSNVSIMATKDSRNVLIYVKSALAIKIPTISAENREKLLEVARVKHAIAYFAAVSFGSTDAKRFEKEIGLRGDGYYCRFTGLEKIHEISKEMDKAHRKEYLGIIGNAYTSKDLTSLFQIIANDCAWHSPWSDYLIGIDAIKDYYIAKFKIIGNDKSISYGLFYDETDNSRVLKLGLYQESQASGMAMLINISINPHGLINSIELEDPEDRDLIEYKK